jgi:hypothetical protein
MRSVWATLDINEFHRLVSPLVDTVGVRLQARSPVSTVTNVVISVLCCALRTLLSIKEFLCP